MIAALGVGVVASGPIACSTRTSCGAADAATEAPTFEVRPSPDSAPASPLALDFSATGCASFEAPPAAAGPGSSAASGTTTTGAATNTAGVRCVGPAGVSLTFTPLASAGLVRFRWTFGDGSPDSTETAPVHTFALPGDYDITVSAGGPAGTASQSHPKYVHVLAVAAGGACDLEAQCQAGNTCWCDATAPCTPVFPRGFCASPCGADGTTCGAGTVCVDLSAHGTTSAIAPAPGALPDAGSDSTSATATATATATAASAWRRPLCLPTCVDDSTCATGTRCRSLPTSGSATAAPAWTTACFAGYPLPIGARCDDATGALVDGDCASGQCARLGRFGRCTLDCAGTGCPAGAACAALTDGRNLCLAPCTADLPCDDDPWVACQPPQAQAQAAPSTGAPPASQPTPEGTDAGSTGVTPTTTGTGAFTLADPASSPAAETASYCSPRTCATTSDCGPGATCAPGTGLCVPLPADAGPTDGGALAPTARLD